MNLRIIIFLLLFATTNQVNAQSDYLKFRSYSPYTWMIGVGWSFVDNDGRSHSHFLDVKNAWLMHPYPTHIVVDRYIKHGLSLELSASFNQFSGKIVNQTVASGMMFSTDLTCRYSFYKFLQPMRWFDPYLGVGVGLTSLSTGGVGFFPTANGVVGTNFWFGNFGIRLQGAAKFGIRPDFYYNNSNYLHYTGSVLYRFQKKDKKDNSFQQPKHKWTRKKPGKYKGGRSK